MQANSTLFHQLYPEVRWWASVGGVFWILFKAVNWFKAIRENDLVHVQSGINDVKSGVETVHTELKNQTSAVVKELQEMRLDFRTYFSPTQIVRAKARKRKK